MLTKAQLPACPVATTVQVIGNKWKLLILRNLLSRPWRFNEMLKSIAGLSQKVLTENLRALERDGIITRTVYPEVPPRVEYALSDLGMTLRPIIDAMQAWGENYQELVRGGADADEIREMAESPVAGGADLR
ncbi:MAG: helix-turn-helix domain-containing protein [Clostridia bacterium]|nr:helix-turn-helix domain-containing protein [Clostridia bacterium]